MAKERIRRLALEALHLLALFALAIAQPLYDVLGDHAQFFVSRGSGAIDLALFVAGVSFGVPAVAIVLLAIAFRIGPRAERKFLLGLVALLAACTALPPLNRLEVAAPAALGLAALAGFGAAFAYSRLPIARSFATALSVGIIAFPAYFVLATPISKLAFPGAPAALSAASGVPDTPVIFLLFDLLPTTSLMNERQEIDAERFPHFGELASESTWFRHATTVAPDTSRSVAAITTGLRPVPAKLPLAADYPANLFTLLAPSHELHVFESETRLCPGALCGRTGAPALRSRLAALAGDTRIVLQHLLLPASLRTSVSPIGTRWHDFAAEDPGRAARGWAMRAVNRHGELERHEQGRRREKFVRFRDGLRGDGGTPLAYLHVSLPHAPFVFLPTGRTYVPRGALGREMRTTLGRGPSPGARLGWKGAERIRLAYQRLTLQIGFADTLLGQVLDRLRELELYERSLIVVVADHGVSFVEGHGTRRVEDGGTIFVPLFVKLPGQKHGAVDDRNAETVDILPTIADALSVELPWKADGRSLLGPEDRSHVVKRIAQVRARSGSVAHTHWRALLAESLRLKLQLTGSGPMETLFRTGPHPGLVGRTLTELRKGIRMRDGVSARIAAGVEGRVRLDQQGLLGKLVPFSPFVPAYLTGELHAAGGESFPRDLIVAVNGIVRATARTSPDDDGPPLALLLPESSLKIGQNRLAFFVAHSVGDHVELIRAEHE